MQTCLDLFDEILKRIKYLKNKTKTKDYNTFIILYDTVQQYQEEHLLLVIYMMKHLFVWDRCSMSSYYSALNICAIR